MQQILAQLQQGTQETVKDSGDGTLEIRVNPPSALNLRAARVIVQVVNERDQVVNSNVQLNRQLSEYIQENERLKQQLKELNDSLNSKSVSEAKSEVTDSKPEGLDSTGKDETARSEAS